MTKKYVGGDFEEMRQALQANSVQGGYVSPGAAVNVDVDAIPVGRVKDTDIESAGATNLAVTAGAQAGESVINAVVVNTSGVVSVLAGVSSADPVAPDVDQDTYALLAYVTVANGAAAIAQGDINNKVRNLA